MPPAEPTAEQLRRLSDVASGRSIGVLLIGEFG